MRRRTTSRRSSSANRRARAGSKSCTARWCTIWCAVPAISACMSSPATPLPASPFRRSRPAPPSATKLSTHALTAPHWWRSPLALGVAELIGAAIGPTNSDLVFLTAVVGRRRSLRPVAVAVRQRRFGACLQFLLPAADLHVHDRRPAQCHGVRLLHARRRHRFECRGARPHPGGRDHGAGADHRVALCFQPQARRRRHARRRAVGDGLPDRADVEGAGRAVVAGTRHDRGEGRLSARGYSRRRRHRRGEMGLGEQSRRRPRLRYVAGRQAPVSADAYRARRHRRDGYRQRQARSTTHARSAAPARCARRSGRARHRARQAGRGNGSRRARRRNRALALGAADLDLARS